MRRIVTSTLGAALALTLLAGPAGATTDRPEQDPVPVAPGLTPAEASLERSLTAVGEATTPAEAQAALEASLGDDAVAQLAREVGVPKDALFGAEAQSAQKRSFIQCMKHRVGKDIRSIFNVNAIAVLIGKEKYVAAAKAAVTYLAKQGVKRNAAGLAASLAYYAARCKFFG